MFRSRAQQNALTAVVMSEDGASSTSAEPETPPSGGTRPLAAYASVRANPSPLTPRMRNLDHRLQAALKGSGEDYVKLAEAFRSEYETWTPSEQRMWQEAQKARLREIQQAVTERRLASVWFPYV